MTLVHLLLSSNAQFAMTIIGMFIIKLIVLVRVVLLLHSKIVFDNLCLITFRDEEEEQQIE